MAGFNRGLTNVGGVRWDGLDTVLKNLNKEIEKIEGRTVQGMHQAGRLVQREAQKITPVDTGNLKGSAYVIWGGRRRKTKAISDKKFKKGKSKSADKVMTEHSGKVGARQGANQIIQHPFAEIGFTAFYAVFVHENLKASHVKAAFKGGATKKGVTKKGNKKFRKVSGIFQAGQAKFLEYALVRNRGKVLSIIKERAKII